MTAAASADDLGVVADDAKQATADKSEPQWVNGDGHLLMPGEDKRTDRRPRTVSVILVTTEDPDKDRRKLARLHNVLTKYPGIDQFKIIIRRSESSTPLTFPGKTTDICEALLGDLLKIVDSDELISVEDDAT